MSLSGFQRRRREQAAKKAAEEKARKGDYAAMAVAELRDYAEKKGIKLKANMKKNDIIIAIMEAEVK